MALDKRLTEDLHIRVWVAEDPMSCVARGAGMILEHYDSLKRLLVGLEGRDYTLETPMIITRSRSHSVALIVDEVEDVLELPEGCLQAAPPMHALSSKMIGVCRMDDGLIYLLDIDTLLGSEVLEGRG